jgi:putative protease
MVAEIKMESGFLVPGDRVYIQGPTTGVVEETITEIRLDQGEVEKANKGETCSIAVNALVRRADKVYKIILNAV